MKNWQPRLETEIPFHGQNNVLPVLNWFGLHENQSNKINSTQPALQPKELQEDCPFTTIIIETCNIYIKTQT